MLPGVPPLLAIGEFKPVLVSLPAEAHSPQLKPEVVATLLAAAQKDGPLAVAAVEARAAADKLKLSGPSDAFKEAARKASPVLLEPVMSVEVTVPEEFMGVIIGDINSRRGRIEGMEHAAGSQVIKAIVPLKEMFGYVNEIRSSTQGRASYSMQFARYEEAPRMIADEIIGRAQGK